MLKVLCFTLLILQINLLQATETCSRIAIINFQEVLVDSNSSDKGEGLRFHLDKDPVAKEYLNTYQKKSAITWPTAVMGTVGTGIMLVGFFNRHSADRPIYLITGAAAVLVNFMVARTLEFNNEKNLTRAVEEYNKRNLPKIYFNPENPQGNFDLKQVKISLNKEWNF